MRATSLRELKNVWQVSILILFVDFASAISIFYVPPTVSDCRDMTPFADTQDCTSYYQCFRIQASWTLIHSMCPPGGIWNDEYKACVEGTCGGAMPTTTTLKPKPTTTTTKKPVKPPPPPPNTTTKKPGKPVFLCTSNGIFIHPTDARKYYRCIRLGRYFYYYVYSCPPAACFDSSKKTCVTSTRQC